jgi:hypothetical protein
VNDEGERTRVLTHRLEGVERRLARLSAALDGASVTLLPGAERLRPPVGPDPALQLQRIAGSRTYRAVDDDR